MGKIEMKFLDQLKE